MSRPDDRHPPAAVAAFVASITGVWFFALAGAGRLLAGG